MKKFSVIFLLFLFACKSNNPHIVQTFPQDQNLERKQRAGNMFGNKDGIILFEDKSNKEEKLTEEKPKKPKKIVPIDNNLWEKTVNFVSSILPISIIDEKLGLITTDWGNISSISGDDNLYKLNIIVKQESSENYNITISAFKKADNGINEKAPEIEEKIRNIILN